jgi:hypothetical protein
VQKLIDIAGSQPACRECLARGGEDSDGLIVGRRRGLPGEDAGGGVDDGVGERATNVNGECRARCHAQELNSNGSLAAPVGHSRSIARQF